MTNNEAIETLKVAKSEIEWGYPMDYQIALDKAIEALEQEPCEDCISRQDVLEFINFEDKWLTDAKSHNRDTEIAFSTLKSTISKMPSVIPKGVTVTDFADKCRECGKQKTRWIPVNENPPKDGAYYVTRRTYGKSIVDTVSYAKDLYTIDKFDFTDKKGQSGWYGFDSDFGYYEVTESIIAWMPLPQPYVPDINVGKMEESEVKNDTRTINKFKFSSNYATTSRYKHNASYNSG